MSYMVHGDENLSRQPQPPKICEVCGGKKKIHKCSPGSQSCSWWGCEDCPSCSPAPTTKGERLMVLPPAQYDAWEKAGVLPKNAVRNEPLPEEEKGIPKPTNIAEHLFDRVKTEFKKHGSYMDADTFAACVTAKMRTCIDDHLSEARSLAAKEMLLKLEGIVPDKLPGKNSQQIAWNNCVDEIREGLDRLRELQEK